MKAIEGVDLGELLGDEAETLRLERIAVARKAIRAVITEVANHERNVQDVAAKLEAAKRKLEAAQGKLAQLKQGNWSPLSEEAQKEPL